MTDMNDFKCRRAWRRGTRPRSKNEEKILYTIRGTVMTEKIPVRRNIREKHILYRSVMWSQQLTAKAEEKKRPDWVFFPRVQPLIFIKNNVTPRLATQLKNNVQEIIIIIVDGGQRGSR